MINFVIWLIVGGIVGWVASLIMRTHAEQGMLLNVIVGVAGAFLAACCSRLYSASAPSTKATSVSPP